jgi:hypothetical protein
VRNSLMRHCHNLNSRDVSAALSVATLRSSLLNMTARYRASLPCNDGLRTRDSGGGKSELFAETLVCLGHNAGSSGAFGQDFTDAPDLCADAFQLLFDAFIAAVNMIDAVNDGFTVGDQRGDDQRG